MSSDIDIEEHDVFDHPSIKKIFPDISQIKTEVIELDHEDESTSCYNYEEADPTYASSPDSNVHEVITENLTAVTLVHHDPKMPNKVIVGAKPRIERRIEKDPYSVQVILKDWSYILENSPYFCKECLILFPTQNTLDSHQMTSHSLLVVKNEVDVEMVNDNINHNNRCFFKCSICMYYFRTVDSFQRHANNLHSCHLEPIYESFNGTCKFCSQSFTSVVDYCKHIYGKHYAFYKKKIGKHVNNFTDETNDSYCSFNNYTNFNKGNTARKSTTKSIISNVNQKAKKSTAKNFAVPHVVQKNVAKKSTSPKSLNISESRNKAVKSTAKSSVQPSLQLTIPQEISSKPNENVLLKCPICTTWFKQVKRYVKHCQNKHKANYLSPLRESYTGQCEICGTKIDSMYNYSKHLHSMHLELYTQMATDRQEFYCIDCDITFTTATSLRIHTMATHSDKPDESTLNDLSPSTTVKNDEVQSTLKRKSTAAELSKAKRQALEVLKKNTAVNSDLIAQNNSLEISPINEVLSKDVVFKCTFCPIHFMSSSRMYKHLAQCNGNMRIHFDCKTCNRAFRFKEDVDNHFLQHELSDSIKVINLTKNVFYSLMFVCVKCKVAFESQDQHPECKADISTMRCPDCNMNVYIDSLPYHFNIHKNNLNPIIVEFLSSFTLEQQDLKPQYTLYYCDICKAYDSCNIRRHKGGNCLMDTSFCICRHCGLRVSKAIFPDHLIEHNNGNFELSRIHFIDIHTNKTIASKIPHLDKSEKSEYLNSSTSQGGLATESIFCDICKETFNKLAYNIHLQYHTENTASDIDAQIMKRYLTMQSLWNILYRCSTCDVVYDNYDLIVEHCQNHLSNQNFNSEVVKCKKCNLVLAETISERHQSLHNGAELKKTSFQVLSFMYKNLPGDIWFNGFKAINDEQRNHILGKSVYNIQRGLRLELKYDGPSSSTLFKCAVCETFVDEDNIVEHAYQKDACLNKENLNCSLCGLKFTSKKLLKVHKLDHSNTGDNKRIIVFNKPEHFKINEALFKFFCKEVLKFNLCVQCNKLIKNNEFEKHKAICQGRKSTQRKKFKTKSSIVVEKKSLKIINYAIIYKCIDCKVCMISHKTIPTHSCVSKSDPKKCPECNLLFRPNSIPWHMSQHKNYKFRVCLVQNGVILKNQNSKVFDMYQCIKCKTCHHGATGVQKHVCRPNTLRLCPLCEYYLPKVAMKKHNEAHARIPSMNKHTVNIIKFSPDQPKENILDSVLYRCHCNLLFVAEAKLLGHQKICREDQSKKTCKCGLVFHSSSIADHTSKHPNCDAIETYAIINIVLGTGDVRHPRRWVWVCSKCNMHALGIKGLKCHLRNDTNVCAKKLCHICNVPFSADTLGAHIKWHHQTFKYAITNINKKFVAKAKVQDLKNGVIKKHLKRKDTSEMKSRCNKPKLFKCPKCKICFCVYRKLQRHLIRSAHSKTMKATKCKICNYNFTHKSLPVHMKMHHFRNKFKRNDFIIITSDKSGTDTTPSSPRKNPVKFNFSTTLHQCGKCKVNFARKTMLLLHLQQQICISNNYKTFTCKECNHCFSLRGIQSHRRIHRSGQDVGHQDFDIKVYNSPKKLFQGVCKQSVPTIKKKSITKLANAKIKTVKIAKKIHKSKFRANVKPIPVMTKFVHEGETSMNTKFANKPVQPKVKKSGEIIFNENAPRLYKCSECNVFFGNYDMCYEHTLNHVPLDPTEYIGCKICDFQMLCEFLGAHMKSHREGTFHVEDLVITELKPTDGPPVVDMYLAANLAETNISSTTT